jgi:hypothetical protein
MSVELRETLLEAGDDPAGLGFVHEALPAGHRGAGAAVDDGGDEGVIGPVGEAFGQQGRADQ